MRQVADGVRQRGGFPPNVINVDIAGDVLLRDPGRLADFVSTLAT